MEKAQRVPDTELGRERDGYPTLAHYIARDPDNETYVFRKFNRMGARNLLHLQCKIIALEKEIDDLDDAAQRSKDSKAQQASLRWETLIELADDEKRPEKQRVEKLEHLKKLLKEYYEMLLLQTQVVNLKGPPTRVLSAMRDYIAGNAFEGGLPLIYGRAENFLDDKSDLLAMRKAPEEDLLSRFLQDHWIFQTRTTNDPIDRTTTYKNRHVVHTVVAISVMVAAILLVGAIISLHFVTSPKAKLGLVTAYTLLFAMSVALLTNARRAEVFAATAAYAAVLVVFVSGDLGGSNGSQCLVQLEGGIFKTIKCPS
ncbi:hypothetical protein BCR34DRAFT_608683 [Clohesyomyces aquaticus]|uniref:DUF6594 domain-containing protein n=1 Tax=Clohesyomyces aquaticus TaxID=1231657 RepID=A0A1Y1Y5D1_9PLEO|nr:hypothetical protein BCR34DRAFT_608683 [Clohesyomyces aquaticus]